MTPTSEGDTARCQGSGCGQQNEAVFRLTSVEYPDTSILLCEPCKDYALDATRLTGIFAAPKVERIG